MSSGQGPKRRSPTVGEQAATGAGPEHRKNSPLMRTEMPRNTSTRKQLSQQPLQQKQSKRASMRLDVASFAADSFNPGQYLRSTMEADTEENIQATLRSLMAAAEKSVGELKKAVWKNHGEFLEVAKTVMDWEGSMTALRGLQSELRNAAQSLVASAGVSSFINLEQSQQVPILEEEGQDDQPIVATSESEASPQMVSPATSAEISQRREKMLALAEQINDFESYLAEGRYLMMESGGFREREGSPVANVKPIILFLFNDALAMASSKKSRLLLSSASKKLSLERFWPLEGLSIEDIPDDGKGLVNTIKVTRGQELVYLLAETPSAKRLWLQYCLRAQRAARGESTVTSPALSSPLRSPSPLSNRLPTLESPFPRPSSTVSAHHRRKPSAMMVGATTKKGTEQGGIDEKTIGTMLSLLDRLAEETDKCNYDEAVELVDKIKYELAQMDSRSPSLHQLNRRLTGHISRLATYLYHEIGDLIIGKETMSQHIQRLVVLGFADEARERFLAARSDFIRERTKHLRFVGDIAKTVNDIGFATFTAISSSADWYISSFKDNTMTAGFVFWTKLEISNYVNVIVRQIFSPALIDPINFALIGECISGARQHCASVFFLHFHLILTANS